jgi:transposase
MHIDFTNVSRDELEKGYLTLVSENDRLKARVAWFERQVFGRKSEKLLEQDSRQATLFEVCEQPPAPATSVKQYERSARRNSTNVVDEAKALRFSSMVPVDEETIYPPEVEGLPGDAFEVIGEKVTERLVQLPTQYRVKRTVRKTIKLKAERTLHTAPAPAAVIERSFADVTLLAGMITDKFQYHLPLYRQHQRMKAAGVNVSRGHLTKLTHRTLELLEPIYYAVLSSVITAEFVSMDETPIKASRREKGKMKTAYFWPVFAEEQVAFVYASTRGHRVVAEVLGEGCKRLLSDGYAAYERYAESREDLVHAQCWAHVRRKFFEAKEHSPPECAKALEYIRVLFEIEAQLKEAEEEQILATRRTRSRLVVDEFFSYLDTLWFEQMVDKTSLLGKAVAYARSREEAFRQFLLYADIPLSNNHVERAIRPVALGRKNWLFCWSEVGAKYAAIAFTLIECCKIHQVDPWKYLVDVLQRIDTHPARDVHLLTPKHWKNLVADDVKNAA